MEKIMEIISMIFYSKILTAILGFIIIVLIYKKYQEFQNYKENLNEEVKEENIPQVIEETEEKIEE